MHTIKELLFFRDNGLLRVVFSFDKNAQSGMIVFSIFLKPNGERAEVPGQSGWCQPIDNASLGAVAYYVDLNDAEAKSVQIKLAEYNTIEKYKVTQTNGIN